MKRVSGGIAVLFALSGLVCAQQGCGGREALLVGPQGDGGEDAGEDGSPGDDGAVGDGAMPGDASDGGVVHHDGGRDGGSGSGGSSGGSSGSGSGGSSGSGSGGSSGSSSGGHDGGSGSGSGSSSGGSSGSSSGGHDGGNPCGMLTDCNGVCVNTQTDPNNCNACGHACPAPTDGTATCTAGACGISCGAGFHACGSTCADSNSIATCGTSCTPCQAPANGVAECDGTSCSYACQPGYSVCSTGCCTCGNTQTDPNNCGYCGHSCGGQQCVAGVCTSVVITTMQANAYSIAADDTNIYWTTEGTGMNAGDVLQEPIGGGTVTTLASGQSQYPGAIAVNAGDVYWTNEYQGGGLQFVPVGGGMAHPLAQNLNTPTAIAISGSNIFFTLDPYGQPNQGAVLMMPLGGGATTTIASGQNGTASVAVGKTSVFWTGTTDLMFAPIKGGKAKTFSSMTYPYSVAADQANVYWTSGIDNGAIFQEPAAGGATITLASNQYYPNYIVADGTNVYWTTGQGGVGTVMMAAINGGTPVTLASGQAYPTWLALNSTHVFWVDFGDGTIRSVPK